MQDEVTQKIVAALAVSLTSEEEVQQAKRSTDSTEAHDAFLQGWAYYKLDTRADLARANALLRGSNTVGPRLCPRTRCFGRRVLGCLCQ